MKKYKMKPVIKEAIQLTSQNIEEVKSWAKAEIYNVGDQTMGISIPTLEGNMIANLGDWVVKGIRGEFYPVKNDVFCNTYEEL